MLQALAMLGAGAQGYMNADDLMRKRKIEDDQLARQKVMQGREDQQYMQAQTDDQAARNAMAPVTVDSAPVAVPIGSRDEPQAPEDRGIRVAGQQFPDQASAQAAADGQNMITARMQRAAGAVQNPLLAAKLGGDAQAAELAGLNLKSAKRTAGNQKFDDDAHAALFTRDPGVLKRFLNDSHADGKNGAVKFDVQTDPATGAQQAFRIADDGALVPFGPKIANDNDRIQALYQLSKSVSPADKEKHVLEQSRLTRQEKRDADLNASTIANNKSLDEYRQALIDAKNYGTDARFDANDTKAGKAGGAGKMSADDAAELKNIDEEHRDGRKRLDAAGIAALGLDQTGKSFAPGNPVYDRIAEQQSILVKRRRDLVAKYRESAAGPANADPRGVRDKPATPNMADAVAAAIKKNGDGPDTKIDLKDPGETYLKTSMQAAAENEALSRPKAANSTSAPAAAKKPSGDRLTGATISEIQQQLAAGGGRMEQAAASAPAAPAASTLPAALRPTGDKTLDGLLATKMATIKPLNAALKSAQAALAAAAKSGDIKALQRYTAEVSKASEARDRAAKELFGNNADDYLKTV